MAARKRRPRRLKDQELIPHTFLWEGGGKKIFLAGSFNDWKVIPVVTPLGFGDGVCVEVKLPIGTHTYLFLVDGSWKVDPSSIMPMTSTGQSQVVITSLEELDFSGEMVENFGDVSDQHDNFSSSPRGEASTQLFLKYPHQAGRYIHEHLKSYGYSDCITNFEALSPCTTCVTVTPASFGADIILKLNDSKLNGQYKLTVEQYITRTKSSSKKSNSPVGSGGCKLLFGFKLPEYTNEQHIRNHFKKFESQITNVELIRDKRTNQFKGFGFVTFSSDESASMAKRALNRSNLLGVHINVNFPKATKKVTPSHSFPPTPDDDREDGSSSDCESISSSTSAYADKIKVIVHTQPKLPSSVRNSEFRNHFGVFQSSMESAFVVRDRRTHQSRGFGIVFFSSVKFAENAIERMRNTTIVGKYTIISLRIEDKKVGRSSNLSEPHPTSNSGSRAASLFEIEEPLQLVQQPTALDCIIIENLDPSFTETQIRSIIKVSMLSYKRLPPPSNQVMVKCYSPTDASAAVLSLHQKTVLGRCISAHVTSGNHPKLLVQSSFDRSMAISSSESLSSLHKSQSRSVKITHLPQGISKEDLCLHFRPAGEIEGEPVIITSTTPVYAYINYFSPSSAQRAVSTLHLSCINGTSITVKMSSIFEKSSTSSAVPTAENLDKVMKLSPQQWNYLMLMNPATGTTMFKEVVNPFSSNPHIEMIPDYGNQSLKFTGKCDAVEHAYNYVMQHLNKELSIERYKMEALYHLKPSLPEDINREFGVRVTEFRQDSPCIRFDGPMASIEKVHTEVCRIVSCLVKREVPLKQECQNDQLQLLRKDHLARGNLVFVSCPPDIVSKKIVLVWSFDDNILQLALPEIIRVLTVNCDFFNCSVEEALYLKSFNLAGMSKLLAKVTIDGEKVVLNGTKDEIDASKNDLQTNILKGLYSRQYTFSCNLRFKRHIEQSMLNPFFEEEPSFKYVIPDLSRRGGRSHGKSCQPRSEGNDEICIYVFCKNREFFDKVCLAFNHVQPGSRVYPITHQGAEKIVMEIKQHLGNKYNVRITMNKASSVSIQGLIPEEIQQCYDEIKERVENKLVTSKYVPIDNQMFTLLKLYKAEFAELGKGCEEIVLWPQNKDHASCVIRINGTISQVSDIHARLLSGLLSMTKYTDDCVVACPCSLFGMWCRRWNQIKEQEEKNSKTSVTFTKDSEVTQDKLNVRFYIIGTDQVGVQEVKDAILSEGVEVKERVISLSQNGISCLLKARKEKRLSEIIKVNTFIKHIDRQSNKVILVTPKEMGDYLETAEEEIRKFVGDRANTSHVVCSKDPVVNLILSTPAKSTDFTTHASAIGKQHQVSVHVQKKPSVGLRLCGTESSIEIVKPLVISAVLKSIEKTIGQLQVPVNYIYEPFFATPDFLRFEAKLGNDLCVACSYPKAGKVSKLICSSLVTMDTSGQVVKVDICKGDLVHEQVDAIVNAANEDLKHIGGLAKAISDAGGPSIQIECNSYIAEHKKLNPGRAVCLGSGDLPCKRVIHAVGPRWLGGDQNEEQLLYFAIFESIKAASNESLTSIAFPAIGTGIFKVPENVCARLSLKAVRDFFQSQCETSIQNVRFVLFNQSTVNSFQPVLASGVCGEYETSTSGICGKYEASALSFKTEPSSSTPVWQWLNDQRLFYPYTSTLSSQLELAYQSDPKSNIQVQINGMIYTVDFLNMRQVNNRTGVTRPIRNIPMGSCDRSAPDIQWLYRKSKMFVTYTPQQCLDIEKIYQDGLPGQLIINGNAYAIDPVQMCQINVTTGFKRDIDRRIGKLASPSQTKPGLVRGNEEEVHVKRDIIITLRGPHDSLIIAKERLMTKLKSSVTMKCYDKLPKGMTTELENKLGCIVSKNVVAWSFSDITTKDGKPQRVMNLKGVFFKCQAAVNAIQEEILNFHISSSLDEEIASPREWQPQTRTTELFPLQRGTPEWNSVHGKFSSTMLDKRVVNISRIQNKWLWEKYVVQKKRLDRKNNGRVNEMELFHGTRSNDPKNIYEGEDGFDMRYGAQGMWGVANYFAVNARYSHNYRYKSAAGSEMFLVNVLTGDSHQCSSNSSLRMPPTKTAAPAQGEVQLVQMKFDTVTGQTGGSQVFMTYDNDKAYPAYLITYN